MGVHIRELFLKTTVSVNSVSEQTQKTDTDTKGNVKSFMKNRGYDMKNGNQSVGQASRLSEHSWRLFYFVMPEVFNRASRKIATGFPLTDCGNDRL